MWNIFSRWFRFQPSGRRERYCSNHRWTLFGISDSSYDLVLGSHYVEHLIDPLSALISMYRVKACWPYHACFTW